MSRINTYSVNLMWINAVRNESADTITPNFETKIISALIKWAHANPEAMIYLWYDSEQTTEHAVSHSQSMLSQKLSENGISNVALKDVREIPGVKNNPDAFTDGIPIYFRVDLLKLFILLHGIEHDQCDATVFSDLEMGDRRQARDRMNYQELFNQDVCEYLETIGLVTGRDGFKVENQFIQLSNRNAYMLDAIRYIINNCLKEAVNCLGSLGELDKIYSDTVYNHMFSELPSFFYELMGDEFNELPMRDTQNELRRGRGHPEENVKFPESPSDGRNWRCEFLPYQTDKAKTLHPEPEFLMPYSSEKRLEDRCRQIINGKVPSSECMENLKTIFSSTALSPEKKQEILNAALRNWDSAVSYAWENIPGLSDQQKKQVFYAVIRSALLSRIKYNTQTPLEESSSLPDEQRGIIQAVNFALRLPNLQIGLQELSQREFSNEQRDMAFEVLVRKCISNEQKAPSNREFSLQNLCQYANLTSRQKEIMKHILETFVGDANISQYLAYIDELEARSSRISAHTVGGQQSAHIAQSMFAQSAVARVTSSTHLVISALEAISREYGSGIHKTELDNLIEYCRSNVASGDHAIKREIDKLITIVGADPNHENFNTALSELSREVSTGEKIDCDFLSKLVVNKNATRTPQGPTM